MNVDVDSFISELVAFGDERGFVIHLSGFEVPSLTATQFTVVLNFTVLVVDKGINNFLTYLTELRRFIYLGANRYQLYNWSIEHKPVVATGVELSTNVVDEFGTGYSATIAVLVTAPYL